jgi:hypothetical protein
MDGFDRQILQFGLAWAPYAGPADDDVFPEFGITAEELNVRFVAIVGEEIKHARRRRPHNLPRPLFEAWSWQFRGNCRDYPLEVFFPEARGGNLTRREERAKRICRGRHAVRQPTAKAAPPVCEHRETGYGEQ